MEACVVCGVADIVTQCAGRSHPGLWKGRTDRGALGGATLLVFLYLAVMPTLRMCIDIGLDSKM